MVPAIAAILCMLALGFVTKYSGMDAVLGPGVHPDRTAPLPHLRHAAGLAGRGPDRLGHSSNVLFGNLQKITALKLGLDPILMASANTTGGVMGKMIDAQSIVVAAAATGEGGREGELLRAVFWHSIAAGTPGRRDRLGLRPSASRRRRPAPGRSREILADGEMFVRQERNEGETTAGS